MESTSQSANSNDFQVTDSNKKMEDVCLPIKDDSDLNKKRKTTAADLVKDLETQPEEHDVISAGCNLDVLSGDVGELELDDEELLGN